MSTLVFRGGWVRLDGPEAGIEDEKTEFEDISQSFIAAETIPAGRAVTLNNLGQMLMATVGATTPTIGIISAATPVGETGAVVTFGTHTFEGWSFSLPGKPLYLTGSGELTHTMPVVGSVTMLGVALSATSMHVRAFIPTSLA